MEKTNYDLDKRILLISLSDHYTYQETIFNLKKHIELNTNNIVGIITLEEKSYNTNLISDVYRVNYKRRSLWAFHHLRIYKKIMKQIKDFSPTEIIFVSVSPLNVFLTKKLKKRVTTYNIIHDVTPHEGDTLEKIVGIYNKLVSKHSNKIIVHSQEFVKLFSEKYNYPEKDVLYTTLWREFDEYQKPTVSKNVLFFGRVNYYKGVDYIEEFAKDNPSINFNIIGKWDSKMLKRKEALSKYSNINIVDRTIIENDMGAYFYNSELVILPYKTATQSGVIIDANKYSRPALAFDVGGLHEQIEDNKTGFLVKSGDVKAFSAKIKEFMNFDYQEKEKFSKNAYTFGFEKYSTQDGYKKLLNLLVDR